MILDNKTTKGKNINELTRYARARIIRICDECGEQKEINWADLMLCRERRNTTKDYCFLCSMKIYNTGDGNPSKQPEVREKLKHRKGKSVSFKDGHEYRHLVRKITLSGHVLKWVEEESTHVREHRLVMAQHLNRHHTELQSIHHIDGDKKNNNIDNLIELSTSEHTALHSQLNDIAFKLVKDNLIVFDKQNKKYALSNKLELETMEKSYGFEHIAIKQKKNICNSRLDAKIDTEFVRGVNLRIPLVASNMSTVINAEFYIKLYNLGALGILHRADTQENIINATKLVAKNCDIVAASIGIERDQFEFAKQLMLAGCNILNIDVAHGYADSVFNLAKKIKTYNPNVKIIIGNTNNPEMIYECFEFADAVKVGIGQGYACETKNTAGCTEKQFSSVMKFKHISKKFGIPIISDGGTREPADFTKAIGAGANSVLAGSIFAACPESAAETVEINGQLKKVYAGMASEYVQNKWKGGLKKGTCAEGGVRYLDIGMSVEKLIETYSGALRSGITYAGANSIISFQDNVEFILLQ